MKDRQGHRIEVGDAVQLWPGRIGKIVCSFEDERFSSGYSREDWGHLTKGALVKLSDGSLFHYAELDEDFLILGKGRGAGGTSGRD